LFKIQRLQKYFFFDRSIFKVNIFKNLEINSSVYQKKLYIRQPLKKRAMF